LHLGHVHLLSKAADFGDILVVALNSDASVRNLKGINRPLQDETTRASIIASLFYVKAVVLFDEDTPIELIKMISPDVLVKGGDYSIENIVGSEWVTRQGGRVEIVPLLKGYSSSDLVNRITIERENYNITQKP
ncbi:MAG TPA: adenylyltransferase/cytidyltransferase family protein, partial [Chitinophagales bacterium]|nr:adenylyltransferase/cytidyltransferase family protein [Chitinophagales bacterium]